MPQSAQPSRWITNSALPNVRAQVTPAPNDDVAAAILGALQHSGVDVGVRIEPQRPSAWQRAALLEAVGDGDPWEPSA